MSLTYVIIGSGGAGLGAATTLRALDASATIICLTAERDVPYNRCLLSDYIAGTKTISQVAAKPETFFLENNIFFMREAMVVDIDANNQRLTLKTGQSIAYDKLFLGTGRSGWVPVLPGADCAGVFPFYSVKNATDIITYTNNNNITNVTVVGGGLSGIECADALAQRGCSVTLIERACHILPNQLNNEGATYLSSLLQAHGITIHTNDQVEAIIPKQSKVSAVTLASGATIATQMVVFALGGKINIDLAQLCGLTCYNTGILTTQHMQTSNPHIFAGGDVCMVKDLLTDNLIQSCLWPDAVMQGITAAYTMAGLERQYIGTVVITSSNICNTTFVTCGPVANPAQEYQALVTKDKDCYHMRLMHHDKLKGFAMVGHIDNVGALRKQLIKDLAIKI